MGNFDRVTLGRKRSLAAKSAQIRPETPLSRPHRRCYGFPA
jgi:hypothetical protein